MRALAMTIAMACALCAAAGCDTERSYARMIYQPRYETYGQSSFFADGAADRAAPDGTVPRGAPEVDTATATGRADGAFVARVPIAPTRDLLERGRDRFGIFCAACHGLRGDARTVVAERMGLRPPPSLLSSGVRAMPPGRIFAAASEGYGLMPSYADVLSIEDRWAIVAYVRALEISQGSRLEDLPPAIRAEALEALK